MSYILHYYRRKVNLFLLAFFHESRYGEIKGGTVSEKKVFSTRVYQDLIRELKHLAVDQNRSLGSMLEEAIRELLKKYINKNPRQLDENEKV